MIILQKRLFSKYVQHLFELREVFKHIFSNRSFDLEQLSSCMVIGVNSEPHLIVSADEVVQQMVFQMLDSLKRCDKTFPTVR